MAGWQDNAIMYWSGNKITDHGRGTLSVSNNRIGTDTRMANGTLRRHQIANKRTFSTSWENLPSRSVTGAIQPVDGGWCGDQIEDFAQSTAGNTAFRLILRNGSAINKTAPTVTDAQLPYEDNDFEIVNVMITDFSKEVVKRGALTDLWSLSITLEEV